MTKETSPKAGPQMVIRSHPGAEGFVITEVKNDAVAAVDLDAEYDLFDHIDAAIGAAIKLYAPSEVWVHPECYDEADWKIFFPLIYMDHGGDDFEEDYF